MKRTILASILGLATAMAVTSVHAQGLIVLNNYNSSGPYITYGAGSGGTSGTPLPASSGWTVGVYDVIGSATVGSDPSGTADPSTLGGGLTLQGGANSTATLAAPGAFANTGAFNISGYSSGLVTLEIVCYNGSSYTSSTVRGHSSAFTMTPAVAPATPPQTGANMPGFSVFTVTAGPEPSIFALSGIGAAALMLFRRKK